MKKFLVSFFIVIIFVISCFIIGLPSLRVNVDDFGIVVSKTSGIDDEPVINGKLKWNWELLLPTNTTIIPFKTSPYNTQKTISGELPSGSFYSSLLSVPSNFNYRFTFDISLVVTPENVISLLKQHKITNSDNLNEYLSQVADSIAQQASAFILDKAYSNPSFVPERIRRDELTQSLNLSVEYPEIDLSVFALTECIYPDYTLYKKLQNVSSSSLFKKDVLNNETVEKDTEKKESDNKKEENNNNGIGEIL